MYTQKTWVNGELIDATKLNGIEQGIADNSALIATQADVSSGSIVFKNGNGTTVFSVALPVYNGEVS